MPANEKQKPVRHGDPVHRAAVILLWVLFAAVTLVVGINEQTDWVPGLTWAQIYAKTGLGVSPSSDLPCQVRVLDTQDGDCILIACEGNYMLVDTGRPEHQERLAATLARCGVERLDYLVLTHGHLDHTGGLTRMLTQFAPRTILLGSRTPEEQTKEYEDAAMLCAASEAEVRLVYPGMTVELGGLRLEFLTVGSGFSTENNRSLVLRGTYGSVAMLLMGDAESTVENALLKNGAALDADWIKLGHHGSKTSSGGDFLDAVSPAYAVMSCGAANEPDPEVLQRLRERQISYARTDLHGDVLFATDGVSCQMATEKGEILG